MYGELETSNRPFPEHQVKHCQEIEELRIICCEETDGARRAGIDELSMQQEGNPSSVSQLLTQIQELQHKVSSLSVAKEFCDPETASSSGVTHVPDQTSTIPSPRTLPCCDSGLPHDTRNFMGTSYNL